MTQVLLVLTQVAIGDITVLGAIGDVGVLN